jgi:tetratricopeptide (TPR) repeat protein
MRREAVARVLGAGFIAATLVGALAWVASGCSGWDPREPFTRNAPEVDESLRHLDAGKPESAAEALERYLGTGACIDGGIGLPDRVRQRPDGSYDLGLALFQLAERFGQRFGDEEREDEGAPDEQTSELRSQQVDCALVMLRAIAADPKVPAELRARALYLAGNLEFLRRGYEDAVKLYDQSLTILPGVPEDASVDGLGRDAAHNRAIALRRIDDQKDAGSDGGEPDASDEPDSGDDGGDKPDASDKPDAGSDGGEPNEPDGGDDEPDAGKDGGDEPDASDKPDAGDDGGAAPEPPAEPPPAEPRQQDDRILDQLEQAPTYQEQEARDRARRRRGRTMEDK